MEARRDGATRDVYLQTHLFELMRALKNGVPLSGFFVLTLVDDYERDWIENPRQRNSTCLLILPVG